MRPVTWMTMAVVAGGLSACADNPMLGPGPDMNATRAKVHLGGIGTGAMPAAGLRTVGPTAPARGGGTGDMLDTEATLGDDDGLSSDDALGGDATDLGYDGLGRSGGLD